MFKTENLFWIIFLSEPWLWKHVADPGFPAVVSSAKAIYLPSPGCGPTPTLPQRFPQRAQFPSPITCRIHIHSKYALLVVVLNMLDEQINFFLITFITWTHAFVHVKFVVNGFIETLKTWKKNPQSIDLCVCKSVIENDNRTQHSYFLFFFLLLFNYSCRPVLPIPPPHPSWTHLPPPSPSSPLVLSMCPL